MPRRGPRSRPRGRASPRPSRRRRLHPVLIAILIFAVGVAALAAAAWLRPAYTPSTGDRGVASLERVTLGGLEQQVLIRGRDRSRPILLFLHGGPGMPLIPYAHAFQRPLEKDFVVVHWDRRGTGNSYAPGMSPGTIRTSREFADALELIELLRRRYGREKVIIVGHSYGAWLGAWIAQQRPDLVEAFVGVGQAACDWPDVRAAQDSWIRARAQAAGDRETAKAAASGGAYDRIAAIWRYRGMLWRATRRGELKAIAYRASEYRLREALRMDEAARFTRRSLRMDGPELPLERSIPRLEVPVHLFQGRHDNVTPGVCAVRFYEGLNAPAKRLVWFEDSAHFPFLEEPRRFHEEMLKVAQSRR